MGKKMRNAPVYFTIAQVRHNPILSLDQYVPSIQESLRKAGYPDFKSAALTVFKLGAIAQADAGQAAPTERVNRYFFSDRDSTRGFVMQHNALSYQATAYDTFDKFAGELLTGLQIVHNAIGLDFSERVGVRYLDAVVPHDGESPKDYLVPEVVGLATKLEGSVEPVYSFAETRARVPEVGQVVARAIVQDGRLRFPPDLEPEQLRVADRFAKVNQAHAVLDTDASFEGREAFDIANVKRRLYALHDAIDKAFRATITNHARDVWG